jgi:hypothetical protein
MKLVLALVVLLVSISGATAGPIVKEEWLSDCIMINIA